MKEPVFFASSEQGIIVGKVVEVFYESGDQYL
jgi:hypothetical protein